jgi:RNA polymerase sigma-70 factor (ECF subfamily)
MGIPQAAAASPEADTTPPEHGQLGSTTEEQWEPRQVENVAAVMGNTAAMAYLRSRASRFIMGLSPSADVDDLMQETLMRVARSPEFNSEEPGPWLAKVVRRIATDWHKKNAIRFRTVPIFDQHEGESFYRSSTPGPSNIVEGRTIVDMILKGLSVEHQTVLEKYYLHGTSIPEIAKELGERPGTIKSRLFYGKKHAREIAESLGLTKSDVFG